MITIYKNKNDIPSDVEYIELNDLFFNQSTASRLDNHAKEVIKQIDDSELISKYKIVSGFNGAALDVDRLSTGCKTVLNVMYFPEKVFCLKECGDNALEILYGLERGNVYSDYALIPLEMDTFKVSVGSEGRMIDDYEDLKEWWENEM